MIADTLEELKTAISKAHDSLRRELARIRTGRANANILDSVRVDYYGTPTPLKQVASISVPEARLIVLKPFDRTQIGAIEKAIATGNLGLNPSNDGKVIRIPIPPLTEERRKELVKHVHRLAEDHKVGVREGRRDALSMLKDLESEGAVPADDRRREEKRIQALTDDYVKKIDEMTAQKEEEILQV